MEKRSTYKPNTAISRDELRDKFPDEETARKYIEEERWGGVPVCGHCGSKRVGKGRKDRKGYYRCKDCRKEFSVKTGTIFTDTKIPLHKWLEVFYRMVTSRKGVSSMELSKDLGVRQATAWLLLHKIRKGMKRSKKKFSLKGIIENDETHVYGKRKNKHPDKKSIKHEAIVFGMKERGGNVIMEHVPNKKRETLREIIEQNVEYGSTLNTDDGKWYTGIENPGYTRKKVNHSAKEYVSKDGEVYTNSIESVWAVLKRGVNGIYQKVSHKHLHRYLSEFEFRLNEGNCKYPTMDRIDCLIAGCFGRTLTYKELVA
ncbi:MAG: IS1595 family transposase [Chitinispirillales bacterium]|jgi:transposase-like protein|nr:IS1595 family transposase [Chitinispirillales bacterium]